MASGSAIVAPDSLRQNAVVALLAALLLLAPMRLLDPGSLISFSVLLIATALWVVSRPMRGSGSDREFEETLPMDPYAAMLAIFAIEAAVAFGVALLGHTTLANEIDALAVGGALVAAHSIGSGRAEAERADAK